CWKPLPASTPAVTVSRAAMAWVWPSPGASCSATAATSASATTCRAAPASPCSGPRLGAAPKPSLASGPAYTLDARGQRNGHHAGEVGHVIHQGLRVLGAGGVEGLLVFDIDVHRAQEGRVAALRRDGPAHLE